MKTKKLYLLLFLFFIVPFAFSQDNNAIFNGGNGDGYDRDCYEQPAPIAIIFSGGSGSGYDKDCYHQLQPQTLTFNGGNGSGYAIDCYQQEMPQTITFNGGNGNDGNLGGCANEPLGCFLEVNIGNDTIICEDELLVLDPGSFANNPIYNWQDGSSDQTFAVTASGEYTVYITDDEGCSGADTVNIIVNSIPIVNLGNDTSFCDGNSLVLDAGDGADSYKWMNGGTPEYLQQTFGVNVTGEYFVEVSNGDCVSFDTINVVVHPIEVNTLSLLEICQGDEATIFGEQISVAGTYYDTLTAVTGCDSILVQQLIVHPNYNVDLGTITVCDGEGAMIFGNYEVVAGIYTQNLTSVYGCDSIVTQTLQVNPIHEFDLGGDVEFCQGESVTLDAGAGSTSYQWMNGTTSAYLGQTYTVSTSGEYFVQASLNGCTTYDTVTVTVHPIEMTTLTPIEICQGDEATIFGEQISVAGTYYDTLTAVTGCDSILVQQLIVHPNYNVDLGTITVCDGEGAMIFGNYEVVAGIYTQNLTSVHGCDSIVTQTLQVNPIHVFDLGGDVEFCQGESVTLDAGVGATSYQWMNGATSAYLGQTYTVITSGEYFVQATLNGCTTYDTVTVTVHPIEMTTLTPIEICQGDEATIFGEQISVAGTYYDTLTAVTGCDSILVQQLIVHPNYNVDLGTITVCDGEGAMIFGNYEEVAGIYTQNLTSVHGCDSIVTQTLQVNPIHVFDLGGDVEFCQGESVTLDAGAGATSYQWMNGTTSAYLGQTYTVSTSGEYFVQASLNGCTTYDTVTVTVHPIEVTTLPILEICEGDEAVIFGEQTSIAGIYYDTITSPHTGCDSVLVQELIVNPVYTMIDTLTICEGEGVVLGGAYQTESGVYYDVLQSISGCDSTIVTQLFVNPKPELSVSANPLTINSGEKSKLVATGSGNFIWTPDDVLTCSDCPNPTAYPKETTTFVVYLESDGCFVSDSITIIVDDEFMIPTGFSPNGDGVNDEFKIVGLSKYPNNSISIYNRWGDKVFEASPYLSDWDGTNQFGLSIGKDLPTGTYFCILDLGEEGPNGEQVHKGYIYLNR